MSTTFTIKRGDTLPRLISTISSPTGPVDFTLASSVKFLFTSGDGLVELERTGEFDTPLDSGKVIYQFEAADWLPGAFDIGSYKMEIQVTFVSGDVLTSPTSGFGKLVVKPDLGD